MKFSGFFGGFLTFGCFFLGVLTDSSLPVVCLVWWDTLLPLSGSRFLIFLFLSYILGIVGCTGRSTSLLSLNMISKRLLILALFFGGLTEEAEKSDFCDWTSNTTSLPVPSFKECLGDVDPPLGLVLGIFVDEPIALGLSNSRSWDSSSYFFFLEYGFDL